MFFNRFTAGIGTVALGVVVLAAGCSSGSTGSTKKPASGATNLTVAYLGGLASQVDPAVVDTTNHDRIQVSDQAYLLRYRPLAPGSKVLGSAVDVVPDLATSYTPTPEGIVVNLRTGAKSQWGHPLTAGDVTWSIQRGIALRAVTGPTLSAAGFDVKNPVTELGPDSVRINAKSPNSLSPIAVTYLTDSQVSLAITDATEAKKHATASDPWAKHWLAVNTASFGKYMVQSIVPNVRVSLRANPNYYGIRPGYSTVVLASVTDPSTANQLLTTGQVGAVTGLPDFIVASLRSNQNVKVEPAPQLNVDYVGLDKKVQAFGDAKVRQAMSLAINRTALAAGPYSGQAQPASGTASTAYPDIHEAGFLPYDVTRAKALMAQSSHSSGFKVTLAASSGYSGSVSLDPLLINLKAQLAQIGIDVTTKSVASVADYFAGIKADKYDMYLGQNQYVVPDEAAALAFFFTPSGPANFSHNADSVLDKAAAMATAAAAGPSRAAATNAAVAAYNTASLDLSLMQTQWGYVVSRSVCDFIPTTRQVFNFDALKPCGS